MYRESSGQTTRALILLCGASCPYVVAILQDVFKSVEKLCAEEGIDCAKFMYRDNTAILDTLEGSRCDLQLHTTVQCIHVTLDMTLCPWHPCFEGYGVPMMLCPLTVEKAYMHQGALQLSKKAYTARLDGSDDALVFSCCQGSTFNA